MRSIGILSCLGALLASGCSGYSFGPAGLFSPPINPEVQGVGPLGIRRMTRTEYISSVRELLGKDVPEALTSLPEDPGLPFHNDYRSQIASAGLVEAAQQLAELVT